METNLPDEFLHGAALEERETRQIVGRFQQMRLGAFVKDANAEEFDHIVADVCVGFVSESGCLFWGSIFPQGQSLSALIAIGEHVGGGWVYGM